MKTICEQIRDIEKQERQALADAVMKHGKKEDGERTVYTFLPDDDDDEYLPCVPAYFGERPADVVVRRVVVCDGLLEYIVGCDEDDRCVEWKIYPYEFFVGSLDIITSCIK